MRFFFKYTGSVKSSRPSLTLYNFDKVEQILYIFFTIKFVIALNNAQSTHPSTSGIQDSKNAYVQKEDILGTWCKLICVENKQIAYFVNIYRN